MQPKPIESLVLGWNAGALAVLLLAGAAHAGGKPDFPGPFHSQRAAPNLTRDVKNPEKFWTTPYGPSYANILTSSTNFVPCQGGPFALCYYSGAAPLDCEIDANGSFANCRCLDIPYGSYFVDINSILDFGVYQQTVKVCGADGSGCSSVVNLAPVCGYINRQKLIPGAHRISTFSFDCALEVPIGQKQCDPGIYAGCMTAPCHETGEDGVVECQCPLYDGPYEVGITGAQCPLDDPNRVWSAAHAVTTSDPNPATATFPSPPASGCIPDLPPEYGGCPLLPAGPLPPEPPAAVCDAVCEEYAACARGGIEIGFTCDAVLCTHGCSRDDDLVRDACSGLGSCSTDAILGLEKEMGCSCCASQICRCDANDATQEEIYELDQEQRERGIVPQCDLNGTLCGSPP